MGNPAGVKRDFKALERRRLQALRLLDQGLNQSEVARRLGVGQQSVSRWTQQAAEGGIEALRYPGRAGRKPQLSAEQLTQLEQLLLDGPEAHGYPTPLWTCQRVVQLIHKQFGIRYHPGHAWKILVRLGWSPQRPVGQPRERDEQGIRQWRRRTWPAAKKKPKKKGARSSSSMKRA
jgi:transposase